MIQDDVIAQPRAEKKPSAGSKRFAVDTLIVAALATFATWCSAALELEVWVMFAGLIAWFTHPTSWREGASGVLCMWLGLGAGAASVVANDALTPSVGSMALPLVVFLSTVLVVGLRKTRGAKNTLAWFVGMVTFFASRLRPSAEGLLHLSLASLLGGLAGLLCLTLAPGLEEPQGPETASPNRSAA